MNKIDIINRLNSDISGFEHLMEKLYSSDARLALKSKLNYAHALLEWINQDKKV